MQDLQPLYETVQKNCHISDGLYAQDYGLCIYLLKMRELYRWEKELPLTAKLSQKDIGEWLIAREQLWENLINESFACIPINDDCYDPFDTIAINQVLLPQGLVYSGGYGTFGKPLFFLGRLLQHEWREGLEVFIVANEYARDLMAPPAMNQGTMIFIRQESIRQNLWERIEEWHWNKPENGLTSLLEIYQTQQDLEIALDKMTYDEIDTLIDHEIGEAQVGHLLGDNWEKMLTDIAGSQAEFLARAVRDHLADCLVTLPKLLEKAQPTALLLYFANLRGLRKKLFPTLVAAYRQWLKDKSNLEVLSDTITKGQTHWLDITQLLLALHKDYPDDSVKIISHQIERASL